VTQPSLLVAERVRRRLRAEHTDPSLAPEEAKRIAQSEVRRHNDVALSRGDATIDDESACVRDVLASVAGFGVLQPFLDDPTIEEIWLNGPDRIFIARGGVSERVRLRLTDVMVRDLVERMLQSTGRRVDISQPFVDASLPDGSRLHVAIADTGRRVYYEVHYSLLDTTSRLLGLRGRDIASQPIETASGFASRSFRALRRFSRSWHVASRNGDPHAHSARVRGGVKELCM